MAQVILQAKIVGLLALSLGEERARAAWLDALRGLGISAGDTFPLRQAHAVLRSLSSAQGPVGVAARLARLRLSEETGPGAEVPAPPSPAPAPQATPDPPVAAPVIDPADSVDLLAFLAPSLGEDKAKETLAQYARSLRLDAANLSLADAFDILESMSRAEGLPGVVARFAKARLALRHRGLGGAP